MKRIINLGLVVVGVLSLQAVAQTYQMDSVTGQITDRPIRILQTNSAGTDVYIFDPATMEQVGYINAPQPRSHCPR